MSHPNSKSSLFKQNHFHFTAKFVSPLSDNLPEELELGTLYEFEFHTVSQSDAYFQCVFTRYKKTQTAMDTNPFSTAVPSRKEDRSKTKSILPHLFYLW